MQDSYELLDKIIRPEIESHRTSLEEFIGGTVQQDFKNEVLSRIMQIKDSYNISDHDTFLFNNGGVAALELVINIFEDMLENKINDEGNKDEKVI